MCRIFCESFVHVAQSASNAVYYAAFYSYSVNYQQLLRQHPSKDNAADLSFHTNAPKGKGLYPAFTPGLDPSASRQAPFVCMVYFSNLTAHTMPTSLSRPDPLLLPTQAIPVRDVRASAAYRPMPISAVRGDVSPLSVKLKLAT